jgi:hypothetical protein
MNAFDVYQKYVAVHSYFLGKYDYFKYNGKLHVKPSTFQNRNDRHFFEKISRKLSTSDVVPFIVANELAFDSQYWLNDFESAEENYFNYKKAIEAIQYHYSNDIKALVQYAKENTLNFVQLFEGDIHPPLFQAYLSKTVSASTMVILDRMCKFLPGFRDKMDGTPWERDIDILYRYDKFLPKWDMKFFKDYTLIAAKEINKND